MPGDGLTHGPPATKKAAAVHHRFSRINRIPCAMVYGLYIALSLVRRAFWPTITSVMQSIIANLASASDARTTRLRRPR